MANKYRPNIVVYCEDNNIKNIVVGFKEYLSLQNYNTNILNIKGVYGGAPHKFEAKFKKDNIKIAEQTYILILCDFDTKPKDKKPENQIINKRQCFYDILNRYKIYEEYVFVFGISNKESEDLKKYFLEKYHINSFGEIGKILAQDLNENYSDNFNNLKYWNNRHLKDNIDELKKMSENKICDIIFDK
ncbi:MULTISPECIES: hypothetical protein [unclassified Campylobacter]|uniref:hypothetical protein n=1 Tax=unclassified Campylobacter TaxID=2593542 RepID=UPI0022E9B620|nr:MULTISPECIES: hypothetical protein [unclassified Campylobacter]MDA3079904.1 hypothetical protein [Campylobacter sp. CS_NA2]MDA3081336.1 hypothetical protein [Campylobacter sp. CS_NA1]MDA3086005.1 hypothetical protein [Campylobacter sp. CS_ED1]MDA3090738.1 hypothetical protein [Campylobacter sp. CS_ED2]WBR51975.1 hypothetical protein PF026_03800 [Campylobacter sp. CS_NA3]